MMLPQAWSRGVLSDLCSLRKETCNPIDCNLDIYVGLEHIESGKFFLKRHGSPKEVKSTKNRFYAGDVIYGKLRPYLDKAVVSESEGICSTDILVFMPKANVPPSFLAGILHCDKFIQHAVNTTHGVNHPRTSWKSLKDYATKIPPLKEQEKIAAALFKIQQAIEVQESIIEAAQELKKSTMQHVFTYGLRGEKTKETEIGRMPESWEIQNISELGEIITGTTPSTKKAVYYQNGEYQFIAPADIGKTTRIYKSEKKITELGLSVSRILPKDTVCIVCIGSTIGKVGITKESKSATNQQINSIIVKDKYEPFFIAYLLLYLSEHIASFASSSPVPIISKGKFEKIQVVICKDKYKQQEIANIIKIIDKKIEFGSSKKSALQDLFKTMLNKLMAGEVRVQHADIDTSCVLEMKNRG